MELPSRRVKRIAVVRKPLLVVAVVTLVPVVVRLIDVALGVVLLNLPHAGKLTVELCLQGAHAT